VKFDSDIHSSFYKVDAVSGWWNTGEEATRTAATRSAPRAATSPSPPPTTTSTRATGFSPIGTQLSAVIDRLEEDHEYLTAGSVFTPAPKCVNRRGAVGDKLA